ncbi:hypothetical protein DDZ18_09240 [Marinicauda salina]|uniref:Uncharacterized protein n=1 Tax=Marinicauda salina TaxID=2135793 RepID=A0A2U2BUY2_9PROT|nr:tetratricopeptide repeat protein [Marinicauda salina]PWE17823.1 hypothetical protein DDZ18_09240 [Marinicauda salina]
MSRLLLAAAWLALAGAPASAELVDVRMLPGDEEHRLWLAFDVQPAGVDARMAPDGVTVVVSGVEGRARRIESARPGPVGVIRTEPRGAGLAVSFPGSWTYAAAEMRQGGVLVRLRGPGAPLDFDGAESGGATAESAPAGSESPSASAPETAAGEVDDAGATAGSASTEIASSEDAGPCAETGAAVAADAWDLDALTAHAGCLLDAGRRGEAAAIYERVLAFEPGRFAPAMELARIREASGDLESAAALYEAAANVARTDAQALEARAGLERVSESR